MGGKTSATGISRIETTYGIELRDVIDGLEEQLFVVDRNYTIQIANSASMLALGDCTESIVGKTCYKTFQSRDKPCQSPLWNCPLNKILQTGKSSTIVHPVHFPDIDSPPRYLRIIMYPLKDKEGNIQYVAELRKDVTAEKKMESEVLRRHHHLNALSRISTATSGIMDLNAILNVCFDIALEAVNSEKGGIMLLDEEGKTMRYHVYRGLSPNYVKTIEIAVGQGIAGKVMQTGDPIIVEDISRDARVAYQDVVATEGLKGFASVPLKAKDKVVGVMNIVSRRPGKFNQEDLYLLNSIGCQIGNAIEQSRLYKNLAKAADRYQVLLRHALTAQEEERKRIARELHDETSQALTSMTLTLQAAIQTMEMKGIKDPEMLERLKAAHTHTVYAAGEVVKLMKELRPTLLDELGLQVAIHRYAKDNLQAYGINVATEFKGADRRFPPEVEVTLFRVAQGLMGNILEHSQAKSTMIKLKCDDNKCIMKIEDDGRGFDVKKLTRVEPSGRGAGLFTMKERIKLAGGHCSINSRLGRGTRITVNVPLTADETYEKD